MQEDETNTRATESRLQTHSEFYKYPKEYYRYALKWCSYAHWTIEETANLLTGCVPHREMFLRGKKHAFLDEEVLATENKIRSAINAGLRVVKSRKHFGRTYLEREEVFDWVAREKILIPNDLKRAEREIRLKVDSGVYTTPCLDAVKWVVENFWEGADLREPPTAGAIIQALLQEFPDLSGTECDMVEQISRHPFSRPD